MDFVMKENEDGTLASIVNNSDRTGMNWVTVGKKWGELFLPEGITGRIERRIDANGSMIEKYILSNKRDREYFPQKGEVGIAVPFPDNYTAAEICMRERCHAHIRCGKSQTYIAGMRMSGLGPDLGLVLRKGQVECYSIERNMDKISNDRGTIILNPKIKPLKPDEETSIEWSIFWFDGQEEFEEKLIHQECQLLISLEKGRLF